MIKYNETYSINNGQDSIVFKEGKGNNVNGEYKGGVLTGTLDGSLLKATYHNKKNNSAGLIEITFTENGFTARWKQGLEPGPMRGKWVAYLVDVQRIENQKIYNIEIFGRGGELVVGDPSEHESNLNDAFDETELDLSEIMLDRNTRNQFELPEWYEIDNLLHINGPFVDEECTIKISTEGNIIVNGNPSDLANDSGDQVMLFEEFYCETDDNKIFTGFSNEKGCLFSGYFSLTGNEPFDINKLKLYSKEVMVNDETIALCIYKVEYNGKEVENSDFSSAGQSFEMHIHS
jgi:hypothetical protein